MPYFCPMRATGTYTRKISAAILLALFAFILVEKSAHGHNKINRAGHDQHSVIHSSYTCLICDFQLAADADLVEAPSVPAPSALIASYRIFTSQDFLAEVIFQHAERGPPSSRV